MKTTIKIGLTLAAIGTAIGCATKAGLDSVGTDKDAYALAIRDAGVIETNEIVALPTISSEKVRLVTWTAFPDSYPAGSEVVIKWGMVWATLDGDVRQRCKDYDRETLVSDTQRLLGLPVVSKKRSFITMSVSVESVFRPCANPAVDIETCSADMPDNVSSAHKAWYAEQAATSYQIPGGYPWTRLGYTYNWNAGNSEVGPAEFVVRGGATVKVISVDTTEEYCSK